MAGAFIIVLRVLVLAFTAILWGCSLAMFIYRQHVVSQEREIPPKKIAGTSLYPDRVTTFKGKKSYVVRKNQASSSKSICSSVYNAFSPRSCAPIPKEQPVVKASKTKSGEFDKKMEEFHKRYLKEMKADEEKHKKKRLPPWDEIEMRRHGLVNRHCDRVYAPYCPSNPSSVDVSIYGPSGVASEDSLRLTLPSDSSSLFSSCASLPPSSQHDAPASHHGTPVSRSSSGGSVYFMDKAKTPVVAAPEDVPKPAPLQQAHQGQQQQSLAAAEPPNAPQQAMPVAPEAQMQAAAAAHDNIKVKEHSSPQRTAPTQSANSVPAQQSVYMEPNLSNSTYAFHQLQKKTPSTKL